MGKIVANLLVKAKTEHDIPSVYRGACRYTAIEELMMNLAANWHEAGLFKSCLNCDHWRDARPEAFGKPAVAEHCGKYNALPPARVIIAGCSEHTDNIPF